MVQSSVLERDAREGGAEPGAREGGVERETWSTRDRCRELDVRERCSQAPGREAKTVRHQRTQCPSSVETQEPEGSTPRGCTELITIVEPSVRPGT